MKNIAFLFPGQGAQIAGMAKDFYDQFPASRAVFETAGRVTGLDLQTLCFTENERLDQTEYTQVALLTAELAILAAVREQGLQPGVTAGQSLGEYAALVAAGYLQMEDAFRLVRKRGILMQNAVPLGQGAMVAVIGLSAEMVEDFCKKAKMHGVVEVSNYNSQKQTVVSGERAAVLQVKQMAEEAHARLATELNVSIPSHSPLMKPAAQQLQEVLEQVEIAQGAIPYVANANAEYIRDAGIVKPLLVRQMYSAVRWEQSIRAMQTAGVELFVEIGPGETLTKMNKKIDRSLASYNISNLEELHAFVQREGA